MTDYLRNSEHVVLAAQAKQNPATAPIVAALETRLGELRALAEDSPHESSDLTQDIRGVLGEIRGIKWVLRLCEESGKMLEDLADREWDRLQ